MSRPILVRYQRIAVMLQDTFAKNPESFLSAHAMADSLEVCYKTIDRDLQYMRDQMKLPLESGQRGWRFTKEVHLCPICAHHDV